MIIVRPMASFGFTSGFAIKNTNWIPTANLTWLTIPNWTPDANTTVTSDGIISSGSESNAIVMGRTHITTTRALQLSVRLLVDGVVVKTLTNIDIPDDASMMISIKSDPMPIEPGQIVTMQIYSQYAGYIIFNGGGNTLLGIASSTPVAIPRGMIKNVKTDIQSSSFFTVPNMIANTSLPGSSVSSDALVSDFAGPVRIAANADLENPSNETGYLSVFINGIQAGEIATGPVNYNRFRNLWTSSEIVVAVGDLITMRFRAAGAGYGTSVNATTTRLNMSPYTFTPLGGTTISDQNPANGFQDIIFPADSGTTMSGASIVVPRDHPNAIITAYLEIRSDSVSNARILVNGSVVATSRNIPGYDKGAGVSVGYPLVAGDLVKVQWNPNSPSQRIIYSGSKIAII